MTGFNFLNVYVFGFKFIGKFNKLFILYRHVENIYMPTGNLIKMVDLLLLFISHYFIKFNKYFI